MNKAAVFHESIDNFAYPLNDSTLRVRIITAKNDLKNVKIVYGPKFDNYKDPVLTKTMDKIASDNTHDYYSTKLHLDDPRFRYHFLLEGFQGIKLWYNEKGFFENRPRGHECGFFQYPIITDWEKFKRPDWLNDAVIYQIFPERFNNGNPDISPKNTSKWGTKPEHKSFFGGDLEGIIEKLDYIKELGANAIYLTPIFESGTNHKYNIADYFKIDPHFGDLDTIKTLVSKAHKKDIKVILDAVFNHCDINFFAFQDLIKKGEDSKYKDWFFYEELPIITKHPVNYVTFATDVKTMPKLNTTNLEVQNYLLDVAKYWMKELNIDGWRLDVPNEVKEIAPDFWKDWRKFVKEINPETYIVGEIWDDASEYLQGDEFDSVMNYRFRDAVLRFIGLGEIDASEFANNLSKLHLQYPEQSNYVMLNLIDSHDTTRYLTVIDEDKERLKLTVLFQMTYLGVPMVYYGDEIGMKGKDGSDCRRTMIWEDRGYTKPDYDLFEHYQKLIKIRKKEIALCRGNMQHMEVNNKWVYAFKRKYQNQKILVIINAGNEEANINLNLKIDDGKYEELYSEERVKVKDGKLEVTLDKVSGAIVKTS
jgi:glycosidase